MADAIDHGRQEVPEHEVRDHRRRRGRAEGQAQERRGPAVQGAGGRLPGGLPRRPDARTRASRQVSDGRRPEDPAGRPLHRRLRGRRQGGRPGRKTLQRLLAGLRRPGEVQGDRAQPDRPGLAGRLPGRRPVRPRRARRGQGEGAAGHRRRRRPGLPRANYILTARSRRSTSPSSTRSRTVQDDKFTGGANTRLDVQRRRRASARSARPATKPTSQANDVDGAIKAGKIRPLDHRSRSNRSSGGAARSPRLAHESATATCRMPRRSSPSSSAAITKRFGAVVRERPRRLRPAGGRGPRRCSARTAPASRR